MRLPLSRTKSRRVHTAGAAFITTTVCSAGRGRAPHHRSQVNLRHYPLSHQKFIGGVVDFEHLLSHFFLNQVLNRQPGLTRQKCMVPLVYKMSCKHFRAKNIFLVQFGRCVEMLNPQAQITQLPARKIEQSQRQARSNDFVFHHLIAHQLKSSAARISGRRCCQGTGSRFTPGAGGALDPGRTVFLERQPSVASLLRYASTAGLIHEDREPVLNGFCEFRQHPHGTLRE